MIKRVLAAVDPTARARRVVDTAAELAQQFGAEIVLFRAVDVPQDFPPAAATHAEHLEAQLIGAEERALADLAAAAGITATIRAVASHEPWRAIVDAADTLHADAIVIGSHGYRGIDRLLGTNAARVADRAHCLVVVVHEPQP